MGLSFDPLKCIRCGLCEAACSLQRDGVLTPTTSSVIVHCEDKRNYFGLVVKGKAGSLTMVRPEGVTEGAPTSGSGGPGAKPILLREPCDLCGGDAKCARACPTGCIRLVK